MWFGSCIHPIRQRCAASHLDTVVSAVKSQSAAEPGKVILKIEIPPGDSVHGAQIAMLALTPREACALIDALKQAERAL